MEKRKSEKKCNLCASIQSVKGSRDNFCDEWGRTLQFVWTLEGNIDNYLLKSQNETSVDVSIHLDT
jgi:hypothetical protein